MFYHDRFMFGSIDSASACAESSFIRRRRRRAPSLWGFGAAAGLLSFPLRAWSSESDSGPDPDPELAGELCPVLTEGALLAPPESCDLPAEAASASHEPALLTVLGSDVRLEDLPGLPGLPEQQEDLVLPQAPEGTAASGGGLFGLSWPVVALVGGGGLLVVAVVASGGSDSDDDGGPSPTPSSNEAPTVVTTGAMPAPTTPLTATEEDAASWDISDWFRDPDGDTLTFTVSGNPSWLVFDAAMGELTIAEDATDDAQIGSYTLTVTATDDSAAMASITHTVTLTIEDDPTDGVTPAPDGMTPAPGASNEAPETTTLALASLTATEGEAATWTVSGWFSDPDAGDTLTYTGTLQKTDAAMAAGLPDWLVLNAMTGSLTIAADATDDPEVGFYTLVVTASDGTASTPHTVTLLISDDPNDGMVTDTGPEPDTTPGGTDSNSPPVTTTLAETSLAVDEGAAADWDVSDWFSDPDTGDTLTYTLSDEPDWLELDDSNGELTIAAEATDDGDVDSHVFVITASDDDGEEATLTVTLTVESTNVAPAVVTGTMAPPATVTAMEGGSAQALTVTTWFSDPDGDTLTFALAAGGPDWATFDAAMGVLSLAFNDTDDANVGSHTLAITATDPGKLAVTHSVTVAVANVAEAPVTTTLATTSLTATEHLAFSEDVSAWFTDEDTALPSSPDALTYAAMVLEGSGESQTSMDLPDWLVLGAMTGALTIAAAMTDDDEVGVYTLAVTASDKATAMAVHMTTLTVENVVERPVLSVALPNRIAPVAAMSLVLDDLASFFTDLQEDGTPTPDDDLTDELTFTVSSSVDDAVTAADENIITAMIVSGMLVLTPGTGADSAKLWKQETVSLTATDSDDKQTVAEFAVTTRPNVLDVGELTPALGFILQGDAGDDELGRSVSGAGDINGDGLADLIAGANQGDDGGMNAGEAYIVYGKTGNGTQFGEAMGSRQVLDTTNLIPADGFIIQGDAANDLLSASVSGAGDVNGDGLADLIVGAVNGDDGESDAGEAYIVYGKTGTGSQFGTKVGPEGMERQVLDTTNLAPADGFILQGDMANDNFGWSAVGAGDINGDGIGDLIVGAHEGDDRDIDAGEAYIVYGKANPTTEADAGTQFGMADSTTAMRQVVDTTELSPTDGFILQGSDGNGELGISVAGAGDVNGDGLDDLIVGARNSHRGGNFAGEAYIIYGKADTGGTQFGTEVRVFKSNGAIVGDGTTDNTTVVRRVLEVEKLAPADGFILQGDIDQDRLGVSVSGAGDINGDGLDDLIVGAPTGDDGGSDAGEAYIVYGKAGDGTQFGTAVRIHVSIATGLTTTITDGSMPAGSVVRQVLDTTSLSVTDGFIIQGDAADDNLGTSVSGAGDVNGDGLADLIAGAYLSDDGGMDAGEAYIIYGKVGTNGTQFGTEVTAAGETRQVLDTTGLAPTDGFILQGDTAEDGLGFSVAGAGDVNGDGFDDLIAGANEGDDGGGNAGEAYVVYGGTHLGEVVSHDQTLVGGMVPALPDSPTPAQTEAAARMAFLHGGAGDDRLEAHADTTVLYGGAGDDVLELADASFRRVDGGSGSDTLVLGMDVVLDFTEASDRGRVRGIETVSLSDDGAMVTLDLVSVYALVESRNNGGTHTSPGEAFLRLEGTGMVTLDGTWTTTADAEGPDLYTQASAKLLIDDGLVA